MIDPNNREKFEQAGIDAIRADIAHNRFFERSTPPDQVKEWLRERDGLQEVHNMEQQRKAMFWTQLGAWAAIVAAVSSVFALFIKGH